MEKMHMGYVLVLYVTYTTHFYADYFFVLLSKHTYINSQTISS